MTVSTQTPLVPSTLDLRMFPYMPLEVARLRDSDIASLPSGDAFRAAVLLWCSSWHQVPASSLPADDQNLARYAGYGRDVKGWLKVKEDAMRGFILCTDCRFYHPVVAEKAIEADTKRKAYAERTAKATEAKRKTKDNRNDDRNDNRYVDRNGPSYDNRNDHQGKGSIREREKEKEAAASGAREPPDEIKNAPVWLDASDRVLEAIGADNDDPNWFSQRYRVGVWIEKWDLELDVLPTLRRLTAAKKSGRPIRQLKYFEGAIADAFASRTAPLPEGTPEKTHAQTGGNVIAAVDKLIERISGFDDQRTFTYPDLPTELDRRVCGGTSTASLRLLSKG